MRKIAVFLSGFAVVCAIMGTFDNWKYGFLSFCICSFLFVLADYIKNES